MTRFVAMEEMRDKWEELTEMLGTIGLIAEIGNSLVRHIEESDDVVIAPVLITALDGVLIGYGQTFVEQLKTYRNQKAELDADMAKVSEAITPAA